MDFYINLSYGHIRSSTEIFIAVKYSMNCVVHRQEMRDGKDELIQKVELYKPLIVCFNGKGWYMNCSKEGNLCMELLHLFKSLGVNF